MKIKAVVTGVTGMVGEGVLHECLLDPEVEAVLVVGRKPYGLTHPKLKEVIVSDFFNLSPIESELKGYNSCFFCLGTSSIGLTEESYSRISHDLTLNFANAFLRQNPNSVFCYVSGSGTDSSEKGKIMWARVKGKTENDLLRLGFKAAYNFRPGYMHPTPGLKNTLPYYKYFTWTYPILRRVFPKQVTTLAELGKAMIAIDRKGTSKNTIEVPDIVALAKL
ncbi:epimerase [Leptospira yasudae]|uniref:Epimerase n=1 Tax=Leptospira yasudae TaxID=2202201 RepID=A0A6N4QXC0_9LEPT|nr:epimerase [Leptospira yasudae]TGL80301.1 epimerase [Leptospira yasudae]TGL82178.1 epimerase [Leptospira yasudae]TGL87000.1 epimerase [Leptospira yasudae]